MTRLSLSILVAALAACAGAASAQEYARPYGDAPYGDYPHRNAPVASPLSQHDAHYDWARVLRVDPVFDGDRTSPMADGRNCVTRRDSYAGGDPYRDDPYRHDPYGNDPYRNDPYRSDPYRNDPYRSERHRDPRRDEGGRTVATVLGGIAGAVLGSRIGDGSGQYIGTAVGTMVGGMAGRGIYDANRRQREVLDGYVTTCDPEPYYGDGASTYGYGQHVPDRAISEYDVTYEYAGREYVTRTRHHPGERIRVRVDVRAE